MKATLPFTLLIACGIGQSGLTAQTVTDNSGSASANYFSESKSDTNGGDATSLTYLLTGSIGDQIADAASSTNYVVNGGFIATLDVASTGPWVTGADKHFVSPLGNDIVKLSGSRLDTGFPTVTVSGRAATVVSTSPTEVAIRLPTLPEPGWHEIVLSNNAGSSSLERGLGVLPILFADGASGSEVPFDLVFKGSQGDLVVWAFGANPIAPIPLNNFLHGLTIDPSFIRVLPSLSITANSGEYRFGVPPTPYLFTIYCQAVFVSSNPGYAPGSFSNMLKF